MSSGDFGKPQRKSVSLSPQALRDLRATTARRSNEREAIEEALRLLAEKDTQRDAMDEFVECALAEWGEPSEAEKARAEEILSSP